jgi:hypothetical protein
MRSRFLKNWPLYICLILLCGWSEYSYAVDRKHDILPGATAGVALSANGDFHRFRVALKAATPAETKVVNNTTYTKATDGRFYGPTVSWSLTKGYTGHPGWGQAGTAGKIESDDLFDGYEISTGSPNHILLKLGYHLTVKGSRLKADGEGGNGTGVGDETEEWGSSFSGVAIEDFNPSEQFEIGGTKSYVLENTTAIIGTTTAGQTVDAGTGNVSDAPYTYKLTLESGPKITNPVTLFQSAAQSTARQHGTLYTWNVNEMQGDARRWPEGKYQLKLSVTPTGNKGAPGEDETSVYVGKPQVEWSGTMVLNRPDDPGTDPYFDTEIGAKQVLRLCAGAVPNDSVHSSDVKATFKIGESLLPNEQLVFNFDAGAANYTGHTAPQFIDGAAVSGTLTKATDPQGEVSFTARSSDLISKPALVAMWNGIEVGRLKCDFAKDESKKLYGIKSWNETYDQDTGWDFNVTTGWDTSDTGPHIVFTHSGQVMTCKLYLRFRKYPEDALLDKNYYKLHAAPNTPLPSLDTGGGTGGKPDGIVSEDEWNAAETRADAATPLVNSKPPVKPGDPPQKLLWLDVNAHLVHIKIEGVSIPGTDTMTVSPVSWTQERERVVAFSDAAGHSIQDDATGSGAWVPVPQGTQVPQEITVKSVNGVAIFYLTSGVLINRITQIKLSADDVTQQP